MSRFKFKLQMPKRKLKAKGASFTEEDVLKLVKKHINDTAKHFKDDTGGWKLNKEVIEESILYDLLGFHMSDLVNQAVFNKGLMVEYTEGKSLIRTVEEYQPIYMNVKTGKLHIVKDSDDKSYIRKFSEENGYFEIGRI